MTALLAAERLRLEALCDAFEADLKAGHGPALADVLAGTDGPFRAALAEELLAVELEHRLRHGERPGADDYGHLAEVPSDRVIALLARLMPTPPAADAVAHFELLEVLGKGAFGTVWKARDGRLGRTVALKLAHGSAIDDPPAFLREARAVAGLRHPNIVRVLDVGEAGGQLYIVREYVEGRPLADVLRAGPLAPRRAAEVARQLADALAHAHARAIVHRDVKPANVLIDAVGAAHLVDFGLAKFATPGTPTTRTGDVMGTPAYMPPEQARGDGCRADGRSDVYSLGVVLFEMLTGERPFRGTYEMIVVQLLHDDAPDPARLRGGVPADLATVCLKCLEKDPARRYASAAALADDLGRWLDGRPIVARPVSALERGLRWVARHRAVAALLVTLLAATAALVWRLDVERRLHAAARAEAEVSAQVTAFLESAFAPSDPIGLLLGGRHEPGPSDARDVVRRAAARIERDLNGQPRVQARLMDALANALRGVGAFDDAERLLDRAAALRPGHAETRTEEARHLFYRGWLHQARGQTDAAVEHYERARDAHRAASGDDSLAVAEVEFHLGWALLERPAAADARPHFVRAMEVRSRLLPANHALLVHTRLALLQCDGKLGDVAALAASAGEVLGDDRAARVLGLLAQVQQARRRGQHGAAREAYKALMGELSAFFDREHPVMALVQGDYASVLWDLGEYREAHAVIDAALRIGRRVAPRHPRMAQALEHVGRELLYSGRFVEAERLYREAMACEGVPPSRRMDLTHGLAWCRLQAGDAEQALVFARQVVELCGPSASPAAAWSRYCVARVLTAAGRADEARTMDAEALRMVRGLDLTAVGPMLLDRMSVVLATASDWDGAETLLRRALEAEEAARPADHPRVSDRLHALGSFLIGRDRTAEAAPLLGRALRIREAKLPPDDARLAESRRQAARAGAP